MVLRCVLRPAGLAAAASALLGIGGMPGRDDTTCVGAAVTLFAACNPAGANPAAMLGVVLFQGVVLARTTGAPAITLVSSIPPRPVRSRTGDMGDAAGRLCADGCRAAAAEVERRVA